ncbi:MAG: IS1380 family transposase [Sedimentisphaerales bacterium]|nr:IS1380 family transposase [Sedimentisphaerales bacterium]
MTTECTAQPIVLQAGNDRTLVGQFNGGTICSDGGAILLKQVEQATGIIRQFAACFTDHRNPDLIDHTLYELIAQRVYALALGYEDLNDHNTLRRDVLLAALVGKRDPHAEPLAGKSTLNRLELTPVGADPNSRYKKIVVHRQDVDRFFVEAFIQSYPSPPECIVLDLDATDDPVHGDQLGKFFHGYYGHYCYLPLYIFCGDHLLCARLRPADIDGAAGSVKELDRIVSRIRQVWPHVQIILRGDSGFCRKIPGT